MLCYAILHGVFYGSRRPAISTLKFVKNRGVDVFRTMSSIHNIFSIVTKIKQQGLKKPPKQNPKKKWTTLDLSLHFDYPNHKLSFNFPSKMISCKLNHNLICLDHGLSSKDLGTNLELLTNRNPQFHWTVLFEPSSKVALNVMPLAPMERFFYVFIHFSIIHHRLSQIYKKISFPFRWVMEKG